MTFNGNRLRVLRRFHGLSQRDLGKRIGSPASTITSYERGRATPKGLALDALCSTLGVAPEFFFDEAVDDEFREPETNFRSLATTPDRLRKKVLAHATLFGILVRYLTSEVVLPEFNIPTLTARTFDDIEQAAERTRVELGAGPDAPIDSVIRMIEHAGVLVTVLSQALAKQVDAFSRYGPTNVVVLNPAKSSASRQRFDLAHELAHGALESHRSGIPMDYRVKEEQADYFASALLLPKRSFARQFWGFGRNRDWPHLFELKQTWGVSVAAIVVRAFNLGLIDAAEYRRRCKAMSKFGWFRQPEPAEPEQEQPELFRIAFKRFQQATGKSTAGVIRDLNWTPALFADVTGITPPVEEPSVTSFEAFRQRRFSAG